MKQTAICFLLMIGMAFQTKAPDPKRYSITLTLNQWILHDRGIELTKQSLKRSDLPARDVSFLIDSVLAPLQTEISRQIQPVLDAEKKADTVKPKK